MNKINIENSNSNSNQSILSENLISLSPKSQEKNIEIQNYQSQKETPLTTKGNVKSYCRLRPNNTLFSSLKRFEIQNNNKTLIVDFTAESDKNNPSKQYIYKYNFTEIFKDDTTNIKIYEKVCKPSIEELFSQHKNVLIFVYGITNSGKTYTVNGDSKTPGILQYSLIKLFNEYEKLKKNNNLWQLTCTYIEIYNEEIFDLLSNDRKKLRIGEVANKFFPQGNIIKNIENKKDFENCLITGELNKSKGETNANPYSSRSHSIFRVELSYKENNSFEPVSFCIVDLAGAERVSKSGVFGSGVKEAGNINSSLLVLKRCFDAMEANSRINNLEKKVIVPIRESKLTMIFKEYFAAHQNISVICTINPDRNDMMDIRSVLNFGSKAMKVKPVKSWIPTSNYNSKEVSPYKSGSKDNSPFRKNKKRFRMFTEKKYLNNYSQKSVSKEKNNKIKEDNYFNELSNYKKKNNNSNLLIQNINIKIKKNERNNISKNNRQIYTDINSENINNREINSYLTDENSNNNSENNNNKNLCNQNYAQRIKCSTNPFELINTNNLFIKNSPSKEKKKLEQELKEKKEKEFKEKISKKGDEIKHMVADFLIKKIYYNNLEQNIEIYENQCNNIDLSEAEILLSKNNNIFSLKNPFIKNYEEDKFMLSKTHQIFLKYHNIFKENLLKNENNINISYIGKEKNKTFEIYNNGYIDYIPNNDFDITRANKELLEELQIKLNNSNNEFEQKKIQEFLDRSFQQYETSHFKAHFGIGESLIKKIKEQENKNENIKILDDKIVKNFEVLNNNNNEIDIANKSHNNDDNIDEIFDNNFNFKKKGKNKNKEKDNKENIIDNLKDDNIDINKSNIEDGNHSKEKYDNKNKKKKEKRKKKSKKKENKNEYREDREEEEEGKEEDPRKNSKERSKRYKKSKKKNIKEKEENEDEGDDEQSAVENKKKEEEKKEKSDNEEENNEKESKYKKYPKSKKRKNESKYSKKSKKFYDSSYDGESEEKSESILADKKNKKKKKKNKKKKIESDIDDDEDNSFDDDENINIKPIKSKKNKSKKIKY